MTPEQTRTGSTHRGRFARFGLVAAAVAGVVGLGGWAAASLMGGGSSPAEAVPADAVAYVSLDLDPDAAQKVEALRFLRRFPALEEDLGLSATDDLRRWAVERLAGGAGCRDLDYDADVKPWIGDRIAVAVVPSGARGEAPVPLVALQVSDPVAAEEGVDALASCRPDGQAVGVTVSGDHVLVSDSQEHADEVAASVARSSLADDADFEKWTDRAGEPGIVTMYVAPGGPARLEEARRGMDDLVGDRGSDGPLHPDGPAGAMLRQQVERAAEDFEGMAGVVRFRDGGVEVELAGELLPHGLLDDVDGSGVADLPARTALALGVSLRDGWARDLAESWAADGTDRSLEGMLLGLEMMTGLQLPEDLERLLGGGFAVAVDEDLDPSAVTEDPASVPAGVRISGEPREITDVLERLRAAAGPRGAGLVVEEGDGAVAVGADRAFVTELARTGGLGDEPAFTEVLPEGERDGVVLFVDLDAVEGWLDGPWRENVAPLRALGVHAWADADGSERALVRLSTD